MRHPILKGIAATVIFGAVHSAFASRRLKEAVARHFGERRRNAFYRPFYLLQSLASFAALVAYFKRIPDKDLYTVQGPGAFLMRFAQSGAVAYATYAAHQVGVRSMLGVDGLKAWRRGEEKIPPEPEAQGPALGADGRVKATGPFRFSRHPLNLAPVAVFALNPRMTRNLATFTGIATLYLILGSFHEESRLKSAYGDAYRDYQRGGVPFYAPLKGIRERIRLALAARLALRRENAARADHPRNPLHRDRDPVAPHP